MKQTLLTFFITACLLASAQTQDVYFASFPALSPDGKTIVFSYEGDLWRVNTEGGMASRMTDFAFGRCCPIKK